MSSTHDAATAVDMGSPAALWARESVRLLLADPLTLFDRPEEAAFPHREWVERVCTVLNEARGSIPSPQEPSAEVMDRVLYLFLEALHIARVGWITALITAQHAEYDEHSSFEIMTALVDQWEKANGWPSPVKGDSRVKAHRTLAADT
jgi:hypothetical protein